MSPPANLRPPGLKNVGIEQHLNDQIPADLTFRDETGKAVRLGDYFGKKPMISESGLLPMPHAVRRSVERPGKRTAGAEIRCWQGFRRSHGELRSTRNAGRWRAAKKAEFMKRYGRPGAADGWHFLTGPQESIDALTKAAGFQYEYDPKTGQFAHATAIMVLTPPRARLRSTTTASSSRPKICAWAWCRRRRARSAAWWMKSCCTATTTTRHRKIWSDVVSRILKLAAGATILVLGTFLIVLFRMGSPAEQQRSEASDLDYVR